MFKNILGTAVVRFLNAILSILILVVNTNNFGAEGMGTIGLIVLGISLILLASNYVGGGALVYLAPRHPAVRLLIPSYLWGLLASVAGSGMLSLLHLIPPEFALQVMMLAILQSFISANQNILLGKQRITLFNGVTLVQALFTLLTLLYFVLLRNTNDVGVFVIALFVAYGGAFMLSFIAIIRYLKIADITAMDKVIVEIFKYGKFIQSANVLQMLNYRLSYYIIELFLGRAALGVYTAATQLGEGVWLIGKSVAMIQYSSISNSTDKDFARLITLRLFKFTFIFTALILLVLLVLPGSVYSFIFSADFVQIKLVIFTLAVGLLATACSMMFSHYFSGTGTPKHNMIASGIALVFTLILGLIFIPLFGLEAAGLTASAAYLINLFYLVYVFMRKTKSTWKDFMLDGSDIRYFGQELKRIFN
jgi:O-antigen/teichoic acid export membrane protein